jgi:hypothetical protein
VRKVAKGEEDRRRGHGQRRQDRAHGAARLLPALPPGVLGGVAPRAAVLRRGAALALPPGAARAVALPLAPPPPGPRRRGVPAGVPAALPPQPPPLPARLRVPRRAAVLALVPAPRQGLRRALLLGAAAVAAAPARAAVGRRRPGSASVVPGDGADAARELPRAAARQRGSLRRAASRVQRRRGAAGPGRSLRLRVLRRQRQGRARALGGRRDRLLGGAGQRVSGVQPGHDRRGRRGPGRLARHAQGAPDAAPCRRRRHRRRRVPAGQPRRRRHRGAVRAQGDAAVHAHRQGDAGDALRGAPRRLHPRHDLCPRHGHHQHGLPDLQGQPFLPPLGAGAGWQGGLESLIFSPCNFNC